MTIRVYVSGLSGNQEVKKRQQRIQTVLESCAVPFQLVDITEAGREQDRSFMQQHATAREGDRNPLPPQIFNEATYCGDFVGFDEANETDQLYQFLRLSEQEIGSAQQTLSDKRQQSASRPSTPAPTTNGNNDTPPATPPATPPVCALPQTPEPPAASPLIPPTDEAPAESPPPQQQEMCSSDDDEKDDQTVGLERLRDITRQLIDDEVKDGDREA